VQALRELEQRGANSGLAASRPGKSKGRVPSEPSIIFSSKVSSWDSPILHQSHQPDTKIFTTVVKKVNKMQSTNPNAVT